MKNETPGPGNYEVLGQMDKDSGKQVVSAYHTVKVRRFGTS